MKITFIGGGSFGCALAHGLSKNFDEVVIFERKADTVEEINLYNTNKKYLPGVFLDKKIRATGDLSDALKHTDVVVLSVPSSAIGEVSEKIKDKISEETLVVSIAKGIDPASLNPLSKVIEDKAKTIPVILSGPSHAEEVARLLPTTLVASSKNEIAMARIQELFSTPVLRVYRNSDLTGVEIGGAVKNIIALAAGISDGIGYGDNTKAALMTRGMTELIRIGEKLGAKAETFSGLTGIGDLIVTCTSMHSRNRKCGILIGQGKSMDEAVTEIGMVVEGIKATMSFNTLRERLNVEMPITEAMFEILFMGKDPKETADELMLRDLKSE